MGKKYTNNQSTFKIDGNDKVTAVTRKKEKNYRNLWQDNFFKKYNEGYAKNNRFFEIPDRFQLRFCRFGANSTGGMNNLGESTRRDLMFKI